jgi:hypothetical protein
MFFRAVPVFAVIAFTPAAASAEPVRLDEFLAGFGDQCQQTDAFVRFKATMIVADHGGWKLTRRTEIPADIRPAIGRAEITAIDAEDGSAMVTIPVTGATFRGLPVSAIRVGFADEYPLIDDSVQFAGTLAEVRDGLAEDLAQFDTAVAGELVDFGLTEDADGLWLRCAAAN